MDLDRGLSLSALGWQRLVGSCMIRAVLVTDVVVFIGAWRYR